MRKVNVNVLSAVDTASATGVLIDSDQLIVASFHAYFGDATAAGTVKVQASNDLAPVGNMALPSNFAPTNWVDVPAMADSVVTATVASGTSACLVLSHCTYRWLRVVYTRSSGGSTTINVNMFALSA